MCFIVFGGIYPKEAYHDMLSEPVKQAKMDGHVGQRVWSNGAGETLICLSWESGLASKLGAGDKIGLGKDIHLTRMSA